MRHDAIAVMDFGGQYAHLIATKVRRQQVLAEICQPETPLDILRNYHGIIISGSPALSSRDEGSTYDRGIFDLDVPILGVCFGHQEIAKHYGGRVFHGAREWGNAALHITHPHPLFKGLGEVEQVWMSHYDSVVGLGPGFHDMGFTITGKGGNKHPYGAIASDALKRYGLQFHPEVDDTANGEKMLSNFAIDICGCRPTWTMENYIRKQVEEVRKKTGDGAVFLLVSGGVDSTVATRLIGMALGPDHLHLLHIDNGLMRKDESRKVMEMFKRFGLDRNLHFVDASDHFIESLKGVVEPERKRHIIGNAFISVFEKEAERLGLEDHILGQGTIYPDTIETGGTSRADTIKTHHNRVPIIEEMIARGKIIEPLRELYKVEVRELGKKLDMEMEALERHPFPGPGLGIRLLCSNGKAGSEEQDDIIPDIRKISRRFGLDSILLPVRSVGVKADLRSYENPVLLSGDAPWDKVVDAATVILSEVHGINRCIWSQWDRIPSRARLLPATVTRERLELLREIDHLVMSGLARHNYYGSIWQCPTVLVPLEINGKGRELVIIRPVHSLRAMTASAARLPDELLLELRGSIASFPEISGLCIDVTSKPPGTIEWE